MTKTEGMASTSPLVIWRITDGKPGHEKQTLGLANALAEMTHCEVHRLRAPRVTTSIVWWLAKRFPPGTALPSPDIILGAGHRTHFALLAARRAYGGKAVVLMRPSLPFGLFDLCLIPEHDGVPARANVITTHGVLNAVTASTPKNPEQGLMLVGGLSKHYDWDTAEIAGQIEAIARQLPHIRWQLTTSRRTPEEFLGRILGSNLSNLTVTPHTQTPPGWLENVLSSAGTIYVTEDSVSMLYEALTAGASVGLIRLPKTKDTRVSRGIDKLLEAKRVTAYGPTHALTPEGPRNTHFNEAARCANIILTRVITRAPNHS